VHVLLSHHLMTQAGAHVFALSFLGSLRMDEASVSIDEAVVQSALVTVRKCVHNSAYCVHSSAGTTMHPLLHNITVTRIGLCCLACNLFFGQFVAKL
jgi:hypothetical protein